MIKTDLSRIVIDEEKREQVIVLKESAGQRVIPIVIGINEAAAIKMRLSGFSPPRPLTHDLICEIWRVLDASLEKVVIDDLRDGTFHAKLHIKCKGVERVVDARPSDSIALAVRVNAPVFVEERVFEKMA